MFFNRLNGKCQLLLVSVLALVFSGSAFCSTFNGTINNDWATAGNWVNGIPATISDADIRADAVIYPGTSAVANILRVTSSVYGPSEVGSIAVNDSLTTYYDIRIAEGIGTDGTITVNAEATLDNATYSTIGEFVVGYGGTGTLNVYGTVYTDTMDITCWGNPTTSTGVVNVYPGGVVENTGRLTVGAWGGDGSLIIHPGGSYSCGDNWNNMLETWLASGVIKAEAGSRLVVTDHSTDPGKTFTAVEVPVKITNPSPSPGTTINSMLPTLSWTAGSDVVSHEIYFGDDLQAVANAARMAGDINGDDQVDISDFSAMAVQWLTSPVISGGSADIIYDQVVDFTDYDAIADDWGKTGNGVFKGYQSLENVTYQPGSLTDNTTYYWRVDERGASNNTIHKGNIWAFDYDSRNSVELIGDPDFQRGFYVASPTPGAWVLQGTIGWDISNGTPEWKLAQWKSSYSIINADAVELPSGSFEFANETKRVVMGPINSSDADLIFMVDTRLETTVPGVAWPHLLADQEIYPNTYFLTQLSGLEFHVEAILNAAECYDSGAVGQFLIYFVVQDRNTSSSGYGKYYWFGIGLYDNRYPDLYLTTTMYYQYDAGTGMMLCQMPQAGFASGSLQSSGDWVIYAGDILPRVIEAFNYFKATGGIPSDANMSDYCISGMNMGWEVPIARYRGEVQVRNLSLKAVLQ